MAPLKAKKINMQQQRFDLNLDNPDEKKLSIHLNALAEDGEKGKWIIRTLVAALPNADEMPAYKPILGPTMTGYLTEKRVAPGLVFEDDDVQYVDVDGDSA